MADGRNWGKLPDTSLGWILGRLDERSEQAARDLVDIKRTQAGIQHAQQAMITALSTSTQRQQTAPSPTSETLTPTDPTAGFLIHWGRHLGLKAIGWLIGRIFSLALQYLLPGGLILWAMTQKWVGTAWQALLAWVL
jgi:hypothetical protein